MKSCVCKTLHFILLSTNKQEKRAYLHLATEKISFISLCHVETDQPWSCKCMMHKTSWFAVTLHGEILSMWGSILPAKSWAHPSLTSIGVTPLKLDT